MRPSRLLLLPVAAAVPTGAFAQGAPEPAEEPSLIDTLPTPPIAFIAIPPCRLADTRPSGGFTGPFGPPALIGGVIRIFPMDIPQSSRAGLNSR